MVGLRTAARVSSDSPTISARAWFAASANTRAEHDITGAMKEQYNIAKTKFKIEHDKLKIIKEEILPAFLNDLKEVGMQWAPGDLPVFTGD